MMNGMNMIVFDTEMQAVKAMNQISRSARLQQTPISSMQLVSMDDRGIVGEPDSMPLAFLGLFLGAWVGGAIAVMIGGIAGMIAAPLAMVAGIAAGTLLDHVVRENKSNDVDLGLQTQCQPHLARNQAALLVSFVDAPPANFHTRIANNGGTLVEPKPVKAPSMPKPKVQLKQPQWNTNYDRRYATAA